MSRLDYSPAHKWRMRAEKFKEEMIAKDAFIIKEPVLRRIIRVEWVHSHGARDTDFCDCGSFKTTITGKEGRDLTRQKPRILSMRKVWQVGWFASFGSYGFTGWHCLYEWERVVMAKATLEAAQYHYARYLMLDGTKAEGM